MFDNGVEIIEDFEELVLVAPGEAVVFDCLAYFYFCFFMLFKMEERKNYYAYA
ncbi:MAG: hypothetical protein JW984_11685 [Deltaproteobacteria bacterium]|uniref:Uncharacterized protein n=1 Tax=Candidatus Zymogenus saltonus TaxID=2844893 RepID=A0A9D8KG39_9DELT|nr:hypothetical protein [Candidatus Zymogenus saltonus]